MFGKNDKSEKLEQHEKLIADLIYRVVELEKKLERQTNKLNAVLNPPRPRRYTVYVDGESFNVLADKIIQGNIQVWRLDLYLKDELVASFASKEQISFIVQQDEP